MAKKEESSTERLDALQTDVERLWKTLEFNRETIRFLEGERRGDVETQRPRSTNGCSSGTVCTDCSDSSSCVRTVYH